MWRVKAGGSVLSTEEVGPSHYESAAKRQENQEKAAEVLNTRADRKGWAGRWPCYVAKCGVAGGVESILHEPGNLEFVIAARAASQRIMFPKTIGKTGLVVVCRPCQQYIRELTMWND